MEAYRLSGLSAVYWALGRKAESDAALAQVVLEYSDAKPFGIAAIYAQRGDTDRAFEMLEKAARINDLDLGAVATYPDFASLHKDPRWLPLMRRLGCAPEQLDAIKLGVKVPK